MLACKLYFEYSRKFTIYAYGLKTYTQERYIKTFKNLGYRILIEDKGLIYNRSFKLTDLPKTKIYMLKMDYDVLCIVHPECKDLDIEIIEGATMRECFEIFDENITPSLQDQTRILYEAMEVLESE